MPNKTHRQMYEEASLVECACGCKELIKPINEYGRPKRFKHHHRIKKYDDPREASRVWNHNHRELRQQRKMQYARTKKGKLIRLKGNKCIACGIEYNGVNAPLFDFHHRAPKDKEFRLNLYYLISRSWEKCLNESKKCDLMCSNCHRLLHSKKY